MHATPMPLSNGLRSIALFEATKGALVLFAGFGLLSLVHRDVQHFAERLLEHFHLNPAARYPHIFIEAASRLTDTRLLLIAAGAAAYALVRLIEAYGLWYARRWAEWLAALSGGIYIPFELFELYKRFTWLSLGALVVNIAIVTFALYCALHADGENSTSHNRRVV
jgi:uncharacterized membrane protein (DUF2068 family)